MRARSVILHVSRTQETTPPIFACVRTHTRVCVCGVSVKCVWIVCVQVVPDKKRWQRIGFGVDIRGF
jgi:hypothetical protein